MLRPFARSVLSLLALGALFMERADARQAGYRLPPPEIVALVDAPVPPQVLPSPDGRWLLVVERSALPALADVSRRMLRLAGMRIDPLAGSTFQVDFARGLVLRDLAGEHEQRVPLPPDARIAWTSWSHLGDLVAFVLVRETQSELWCVSVHHPDAPARLVENVSTVLERPVWTSDGRSLICTLVPEERGPEPEGPVVPAGPIVQETAGTTSPLRTYQDLLASEHDEILFEHHATSVVARVGALTGEVELLDLPPSLFAGLSPSPDGRWLLLACHHRPFSYLMPWSSFPHHVIAFGLDGQESVLVADLPLAENVPIEGVPTGPRMVQWKPNEAATLVWAEALDGGDPRREVPARDRWMLLDVATGGAAREILRTEHRATGLTWMPARELVLASEYDRDRRWTRSLLHDLAAPVSAPRALEDRSIRDRYGDPGRIVTMPVGGGLRVAIVRENAFLRAGEGATPDGFLPFVDRQDLGTGATERLWRCSSGSYETFVQALPAEGEGAFLTRRETPDEPSNWYVRIPGEEAARTITRFPDPQPSIRGITKRLLAYTRADGVALSGTLYLPSGYVEGTRLPLFVWAYPVEFNDAATAGQIATSPWTFTELRGSSHLFLLTQGWAVLDGATIPIVGDPLTMNDTFVDQLVSAARAAIDAVVDAGVADPERVAVGGHSYGAFMTANLLAHCDLFRAGVARSGAYNRTLTPFGFQAERRTLWEAPGVYTALSPFFHADLIDEPLLLVHGQADDNSGTFPVQSERLFQAIKGHGGMARLVVLPAESHGYRARESILHVLAETIDWLDRHVKSATPRAGAASGAAEDGE